MPLLKTAKGQIVLRPRGMKGFVWDHIVDEKLDVNPVDMHFKPKPNLPRILTSDVFYDLRKPLEAAGYDVTSREAAERKTRQTIQVQYIKQICDSLGIRRVDIGVLAGEAGHLFYRGEHYAISLDELDSLKLKGVIILIIEKRGIAELLRYLAKTYGIAFLSTEGFLTENAVDLAYLASRTGGKVAILTDYDISGMVIAHQVPQVPRIGIDEQTLEDLLILNKQEELEEYYTPNPSHLTTVKDNPDDFPDVDLDYLKDKRVEINAVRKEVGSEQFWEWVVSKLEELFGEDLNYNRAVDIPEAVEFVPDELRSLNTLVIDRIRDVLVPATGAKYEALKHYNATDVDGLIHDVFEYEDSMRDEFQDVVDESADTGPIVKDIKKLIKKHGENRLY